jgi:hypothetical protein
MRIVKKIVDVAEALSWMGNIIFRRIIRNE